MSAPERILVVEDSPTQAAALRFLLEREGYEITEAADGAAGLEAARLGRPSLIVSDIRMPVMDGFEMCRLLKQDEQLGSIPVILLTSLTDMEDVLKGLDVNADYYITKPYQDEYFLSKIRSILSTPPISAPDAETGGVEVSLGGRRHTVTAGRRQILGLLLSTYENAVLQYRELTEIQEKLEANLHDLASSEERFRSLVMTIPDIVYRIDADGRYVFLNNAIRRLGYEPAELLGRHFTEIIVPTQAHLVSRRDVLPRLAGESTGDARAPKLFDERRRGERLTAGLEVSLLVRPSGAEPLGLAESIGAESTIVEVNASGVYSAGPQGGDVVFVGTVGVIRDISERKRMERELKMAYEGLELKVQERTGELTALNASLQSQIRERERVGRELQELLEKMRESQANLVQAEKMSAVGTLVAGVAHELNNPLMSILNFVQYAAGKAAGELKLGAVLKDAEHETKRCIGIVADLLTFSRTGHQGEEPLVGKSCLELFGRVIRMLTYRIDAMRARVTLHTADDCTEVPMRENEIQQVFLNLVLNALDAVADSPRKEVDIEIHREGDLAVIAVADTGRGIPPELRERIFDPFFTTKTFGQATGLGLSVARSIVLAHGGELLFRSTPGQGTAFVVRLPIRALDARAAEGAPA